MKIQKHFLESNCITTLILSADTQIISASWWDVGGLNGPRGVLVWSLSPEHSLFKSTFTFTIKSTGDTVSHIGDGNFLQTVIDPGTQKEYHVFVRDW